jgi:FkbM family methyltransferase
VWLLRIVRLFFPAAVRARARSLMFRWLDLYWTTARGVHVRVDNFSDWVIYHEVFVEAEYDEAIDLALASAPLERPFRALDLGAHAGYFTLRLVDRARLTRGLDAPLVITAVEPRPDSAAAFTERVLHSNALTASVTLVQGLVGKRSGTALLDRSRGPGSTGIMTSSTTDTIEVPFVDLSALVAGDAVIDLIKCDIEGAELMLLENHGDVFAKARVVAFELHDPLCHVPRCRALLQAAGFVEQPGQRSRDGFSIYVGRRDIS